MTTTTIDDIECTTEPHQPSRLDTVILWVLSYLTAFLACDFKRRENHEIYMIRYYLLPRFLHRFLGVGVYIQEFVNPDSDSALHDHPFAWSYGIPLVGGYQEERIDRIPLAAYWSQSNVQLDTYLRTIKRGNINAIDDRTFHRIDSLLPGRCITLFIAGPRVQDWGFLVPGRGWVQWRARLKERGITQ